MPDLKKTSTPYLRYAVLAVLLAAAGSGIWWITHKPSAAANEAGPSRKGGAQSVGVSVVQRQDAPLQLTALGTVAATATVTLRSRVDGQLEKIYFSEGQMVKQGQLLAELDPRPYQALVLQAEGQLLRDQALLKNAQIDLQRYRLLLSQNSIAQQQLDTQEALERQYQGTVKIDQGTLDNARLQLSYSRISAPLAGRIGLRQVDLGNIVHASDTNGLLVITQTDPINVVFAVPENNLTQVLQAAAVGKTPLKVEAWDRDNRNKISDGVLLAIDNQLNATTGTVNIKAKFANANQTLFPNQFVNIHLQLGVRKDVLTVATAALQLGKVGNYVYLVNADETVTIRKLKLGAVSGDNTIVEEGLEAGQKVVIDGLDKLRDGAKIKLIERSAKPAAGAARRAAASTSASAPQ
ncbi:MULTISPECIES: MdtA/MuxA family multidrug efflux RND transporter periplasmic adaptor subunit [unclassified Undibacterium]|uniref:MdtA/MuxA family multidrug efflux RND transporter periplasmic adaptor subunit n=1 Tax=unclassified Undibacterium TaxID=2630295 RepID=UPI002AC99150|nr:MULTISPECIES: MdtA/MuxA family multidrug efflux RND transporter periplasmic adaptor subunit [unclassified Undibacterium]MEB0140945.1 MdtA/MuxA family multidrug efflux RND transporter periplasmic adaptor subunit [Undibacterium sp. CCC2.1]MEB0173940.1 MdtA/MuxA family multidrug efflux RND transporter periplasmic adaptor subunit [Undibacterium sp. CCC1.1]MEB0177163.1 MdtA/MuxA family multidrug efflux RND transporter periplasmic adaptor subunit [Undibacterium sp. CCC3.4]MEB0217115.1 MdtA/MuxA fa